jgi:hypothetical protein
LGAFLWTERQLEGPPVVRQNAEGVLSGAPKGRSP